jgi:hypothetical protein
VNHLLGIRLFFLIGCVEESCLKESVRRDVNFSINGIQSPQPRYIANRRCVGNVWNLSIFRRAQMKAEIYLLLRNGHEQVCDVKRMKWERLL